jgi:hypothetical protein
MLNFGLMAHLGLLNQHKLVNTHKLYNSHVVKFYVFLFIVHHINKKKPKMPLYRIYMCIDYCFAYSIQLSMLWLHHSNFGSFMHSLNHVCEEPRSEVQAEQTWAKAPTNVALDQGKSWCIPPNAPCLLFWITIYVRVWLCKSIGTIWYHSCIKFNLPNYPC